MNTLAQLLTVVLCWGCLKVSASASQLHRVNRDGVVYAAAPQERGSYSVGAAGGQYNYGYNTGDGIAKVEVRQPDGSIVGSYRYFDPTGKQVVRSYIADKRGFRVLGNDLPISPDTPASKIHGLHAFTGAVEGTSEFAIPPPLGPNTVQQTHSVQLQQQQAHQKLQQQQLQEKLVQQSQQQQQLQEQLVQKQQEVYRKQQQQLEEQRRQLQLQQEKLEALQRELETQQLKIQQQIQQPQFPYQQQQLPVQQQPQPFQMSTQHHYQTSILPQQQGLPHTKNHLTGGITSPYFLFDRQINYDFPAGFAYLGMPTITSPASNTPYPKSSYVIGQSR
ncbi:probable basic-leucine zipper transcription factor N [Homarus americanus]|uniref:probable basic-leucine zipper transcription factor N n=1 Tax=Homarus americanus TaxID=6706 RepID=UPI001C467F7E|nr:probable basic-leucine zipper transcription factor N [Homarus americanus]